MWVVVCAALIRDNRAGRLLATPCLPANAALLLLQILQQNVLLKYKYLVTFLRQHGLEVFDEVRAAYVDTLSRVLSSKFRAYISATEKLLVSHAVRVMLCTLCCVHHVCVMLFV